MNHSLVTNTSFARSIFTNTNAPAEMNTMIQAGVLPSPVAHSKSSSSVISSLSSDQYEKLIYPLNNTPTGNQVCTGGQGGGSGVTMQPLINQATLTYPTAPKTATGNQPIHLFSTQRILDSGGTIYITCSTIFYTSYYPIVNMFVQLHSKTLVKVTHRGTIKMNYDIILKMCFVCQTLLSILCL